MPQNTPSTMRIVPSGKIYRQLFDAQFQLSQTLTQFTAETRNKHVEPCKHLQVASLPIIRLSQDEMKHGILTSRQKSWVAGLPNDPYTENPVMYKQYSDYLNQKVQETKLSQAEKEVNRLPDVVVAAKKESDVIERVTQNRRQRHEAALKDMYNALMFINMKIEKIIEEQLAALQNQLARSDDEISNLFDSINKDEDLTTCQMRDLNAVWEQIEAHSARRQRWIARLNSDLQNFEVIRLNKIREVFTTYGKTLQHISFLMLPDLQRLLDKESQKINQEILSNYRSYADLYVRLTYVDIERERTQHKTWLKRTEDWRIANTRVSVQEFKEFMKSDAVISPAGVEAVKSKLLSDIKMLNDQRLELIRTLCDMQPPNSTKSAVQKWQKDLKQLSEEIDNILHMHLGKLHEEYEHVCKMCLEKVDSIKMKMIEAGICSSHTSCQVIDEFMLPLVGKQQKVFELNLENVQNMTEVLRAKTAEEIAVLYRFAKGAADLWDVHENNLAKRERELHEVVEKTRKEHDQSRQEQEALLDSDLDRLRQEASEMALKESLVKVLTLLENIKELYEAAHKQQIRLVENYPAVVNRELLHYNQAVCQYFSVLRVVPSVLSSKLLSEEEVPSEMADDISERIEIKSSFLEAFESHSEAVVSYIRSPIGKITTSKGTEFYVLQEDEEVKNTNTMHTEMRDLVRDEEEEEDIQSDNMTDDMTFLTEIKEEDSEYQTDSFAGFAEAIDIPMSVFSEIRDIIRMNFLEHLDDWNQQAVIRANTVMLAKSEELNGELDLKLHLHQPRPRRVELDVHNVRAAELVLHAERVTRHCSGVDKSVSELRSKFKVMSLDHNKIMHTFEDAVQSLEETFIKATKSASLVKLQNQVAVELDKFMSSIRASLRQFHQHLDETLQKLRGSNAKFIKSFRLFSDGGNFCPEEIEIYRKKLDRMSLLIDQAEGSLMSELESVESKYLDSATKIASDFSDRFKGHMSDIIFMECVGHVLTNIQVKIKAEVSKSNAQAQKIAKMLKELQERLSAWGKPSLDKEPVTASQLNDSLLDIFKTLNKRSIYLHCRTASNMLKDESPSAVKDTLYDANAVTSSTNPATGIIKSIFKAQAKAKEVGFHLEPEKGVLALDWEKNKSQFQESNRSKSIRKISGAETVKETGTGKLSVGKLPKFDKKQRISTDILESLSDRDMGYHFLSVIRNAVKETLEGLITTAEVYYYQKGARQITRPQAIPETCEQCADILSLKLQSYYSQAEIYHNQCLKDFQDQLIRLERLCSSVPAVIIADLLKTEVVQATDVQDKLTEEFQAQLCCLNETQKCLENELRPALGHPQRANYLAELCAKEKKWYDEYAELVMKHVQEKQESALEHARVFLDTLVEVSEQQLQQFDKMLVIDEIDKGKVEPQPQSTYELIRLMKPTGPPEEKTTGLTQTGKTMWTGIPSNQFFIGEKPSTLEITATVQTNKSTLAHSATIDARNKAFEDYKKYFEGNLQQIEEMKEKYLTSQNNWNKSWESSVKKIISLYQKEE
ncbi:hypothetical protein BsWGS_23322 [Bradybaena similaris]